MRTNKIAIIFLFLIGSSLAIAENDQNSPYTRYGYGHLKEPSFGNSKSMGGIGYGLRSNLQVNPMNPASYSAIDSMTFILDVGLSGGVSLLTERGASQTDFVGNLDYIAMQFPLYRWWGMSVGLIPFSTTGYSYTNKGDEVLKNQQTFTGSGGFSQLYLGTSFKMWNRLSLGFNISYLFGSISHISTSTVGGSTEGLTSRTTKITVNDYKLDFGLQYSQPIGKKHRFTLGAVYSYQRPLNLSLSSSFYAQTADTTMVNKFGGTFTLPHTAGVGFTYEYNKKLTVGFDVSWQGWSQAVARPDTAGLHLAAEDLVTDYKQTFSFTDRMRYAVGAEYIPNPNGRKYYETMRFRLGANYGNNYMSIKGQQINEYGITFGLGFPIKGIKSMINVGFEYNRVESAQRNLVSQDLFKLSINLTFNEFWFFKRQFE